MKPLAKKAQSAVARDDLIEGSTIRKVKLTNEEVNSIQMPFLMALKRKMDEDGLNGAELCKKLSIPYSYLVAITNGFRIIGQAERNKIEAFAEYLKVPVVQIYLWGGLLTTKDFIVKTSLKERLDKAYTRMADDPILTSIMPASADWQDRKQFSEKSKIVITRLYELLIKEMLLEYAKGEYDEKALKKVRHIIKRK